ncbi:MAG: hypothetical protein NVSMB9_08120 [Isosphaeraceae bacterium]
MNIIEEEKPILTTKIRSTAQVIFCVGCCCGRTDRGLPEVPVERLKAAWKAEKLNRCVQLTISGCLGPCDVPNVAAILTPSAMHWFGLLNGDADYDAILSWARESVAQGEPLPIPESLNGRRLQRFAGEPINEESESRITI